MFTQELPLHPVGAVPEQFETQPYVAPDPEHSARFAGQTLPHTPQLLVDVMSTSHPSSGFIEQCAKPGVHAPAPRVQTPATQVTVPVTFFRVVQSWPHFPQLSGSSGTHVLLQSSWVPGHSGPVASGPTPASPASPTAPA